MREWRGRLWARAGQPLWVGGVPCIAAGVAQGYAPALKAVAMACSMSAVALELQPELCEPTIRYAVQPLHTGVVMT